MLLKELQIEGFRSLKSVTWKPGRLNVLIGPNGGGKSNLLRALDLLRIAAKGGLRDTIIDMGGMAPLLWDGRAQGLRFNTGLSYSDKISLNYELELSRLGALGSYVRNREHLSRLDQITGVSLGLLALNPLFNDDANEAETNLSQVLRIAPINPPDDTAQIIVVTQAFFSQWAIHCDMRVDQGSDMRSPPVARSENRVRGDGQNLVAVLHTNYTTDPDFRDLIDKAMSAAFPDDYDKLEFPPVPAAHSRIDMRLWRKHRKRPDSPADLSDGTLRFLLLATILGSTHPAPLIAIDEPEAGLHPRMMSIIAEIAASAAMKSQVIFSTHSPQFLDAFSDDHDDLPVVTVVTSNGSETQLKNIDGEELKRWVEGYSLGKFAFSGEAEIAS